MTTKSKVLTVSGLKVEVVRKAIKNLHLGVYPPEGRVRVAAPLAVSDAAVRVAVITKLRWIRRQQATFKTQPRETQREYLSGESHYYLGRRYRLHVVETTGKCHVVLRGNGTLELHTRPSQSAAHRERVLWSWYLDQLKALIPPLLQKWQPKLGITLSEWGTRRMKTKWGSCTPGKRRIWVNPELIKKPPECLEYLVVHELLHLVVKRHDEHFFALLDQHLPNWRAIRRVLNAAPLAHTEWQY